MKIGQVITKQMLLAFCLCSECRFQLYKWDRSIYVLDSVSKVAYYISQRGNRSLHRSQHTYVYILEKSKITTVDELILLMKDRIYGYFD